MGKSERLSGVRSSLLRPNRNRQPKDWSQVINARSNAGTIAGMIKAKGVITKLTPSDEIFKLKKHLASREKDLAKTKDYVNSAKKMDNIDNIIAKGKATQLAYRIEKDILRIKKRLKTLDKQVMTLNAQEAARKKAVSQSISIQLDKVEEQERAKKLEKILSPEQKMEINRVFPEFHEKKLVKVGGKRKLQSKGEARFSGEERMKSGALTIQKAIKVNGRTKYKTISALDLSPSENILPKPGQVLEPDLNKTKYKL